MMQSRLPQALLPIALFTLILAACGGNGGAKQSSATATQAGTPVLTGTAKEFVDLLGQGLDATYKITYRTISPEGDEGDTYVIFNKPPLTRIDTVSIGASDPSTLLIGGDRETTTISCSGGPDDWQCFDIEPLGDSLLTAAGPVLYLTPFDLARADVSDAGERTVAGEVARCFRLSLGDGGGEAEYCLSAFGVPLSSATEVGTVEATEVTPTVDAEDFTPPAEAQ